MLGYSIRMPKVHIYGKKAEVETDHKPLETITRKSTLSAPRQLQQMLLTLLRYTLDVVYHLGSQQVIADTLSRLPVEIREEGGSLQQEFLNIGRGSRAESKIKERDFVGIKEQRLVEIQRVAATDPEQRILNQATRI